MASIEKTVFISYRRKDIYTALAVYQHLTGRQYDVFLDYTSIPSGDFEQIIVSNIKARAHFVLILTPTALDRCNEPGDWLRREIETAIDEKRNIIPLFFDGFRFSAPGVAEKLTGKLGAIRRYNGLEIHAGYFKEAMERLSEKYLNVPLDAVLHPVPTEVRKVVEDAQVAANQALEQERENIEVLVKPAARKPIQAGTLTKETIFVPPIAGTRGGNIGKGPGNRLLLLGAGLLILLVLGFAFWSISQNSNPPETATPTQTQSFVRTSTVTFTPSPTYTPTLTITPTYTPTPTVISTGAITGTAFSDFNGNGIPDSGEVVQGLTVTLYDSTGNTMLGVTTTNSGGRYTFQNLNAGTYYVKWVVTGCSQPQTREEIVNVNSGDTQIQDLSTFVLC